MSALLLLSVLGVAEPTYRLEVTRDDAAAECPDEGALRRSIAERLGRDAVDPTASKSIQVRFSSKGTERIADITVSDSASTTPSAKRTLTSNAPDCRDLAQSTALAISIAVDPFVLTRPPPKPAEPAAVAPPPTKPASDEPEPTLPARKVLTPQEQTPAEVAPPPPEPVAVPAPPPPPPAMPVIPGPVVDAREKPLKQLADLMVWGAIGMAGTQLPTTTLQLDSELLLVGSWWALGGGVHYAGPSSMAYQNGSVAAVLAGLGPMACVHGTNLGLCGVAHVGFVQTWASGLTRARGSTSPHLAIGLAPYYQWSANQSVEFKVSLVAEVQPVVTVAMVGFSEVWRSPIFGLSATFGVGFRAIRGLVP